jgi:hypothetical protein
MLHSVSIMECQDQVPFVHLATFDDYFMLPRKSIFCVHPRRGRLPSIHQK